MSQTATAAVLGLSRIRHEDPDAKARRHPQQILTDCCFPRSVPPEPIPLKCRSTYRESVAARPTRCLVPLARRPFLGSERRSYQLGLTRGEWLRCSEVPASRRRRCQMATTANATAITASAMVLAVRMRLPVVLM